MLLILFFYPERRDCLAKVLRYVAEAGGRARVVEDAGLRAIVDVEGVGIEELLQSVDCLSRVAKVVAELPRVGPEELPKLVAQRVSHLLRERVVAVRARRWDKTYPSTSVDIAKSVAKALEERGVVATPRARDKLLLCIGRDEVLVALVESSWERSLDAIPRSVARRVRCVACNITTPYEVADLVQMARALDVRLVLLNPVDRALREALAILGLENLPPEVNVVSSVDEALSGVDEAVLLTRFGSGNEKTLIDLLTGFVGSVALVVGNEYSDPPPEVRDRCRYSVRLGPETGKPMRSCVALAYALGIALSAMSGFL